MPNISDINKIIVYNCVTYYGEIWRLRNERRNHEVAKKERLLEWAKSEYTLFKNHTDANVSRYFANYYMLKNWSADAIKNWLINLHTFKKNSDCRRDTGDIRSYLLPQG